MIVELDGVAIAGVLPPTSAVVRSGSVTIAVAETEQGPTILSLVAAGRIRPDSGSVSGAPAAAIALVDTPGVAEPPATVRLSSVVAEELVLAGRPGGRRAVSRLLRDLDAEEFAAVPIAALPARVRLTVLSELAALRPGVETLVITSPERHGGSAREWLGIAQGFADRGLAVLVVTSRSAATSAVSRPSADLVAARSPRASNHRTYLESTRS